MKLILGFILFPIISSQYSQPNSLQRILTNDELQCIPRLLCEQIAGSTPGQLRGLQVDTQSLTTLFKYLGIDQPSPLWNVAQAMMTGITNRGDSFTCYQKFPNCPRDQSRLLYYLNNHRGGFFRGFSRPYYGRSESESRIVNKDLSSPLVFYNNIEDFPNEKFVFGTRSPKTIQAYPTDRLPSKFQFPPENFNFFPTD